MKLYLLASTLLVLSKSTSAFTASSVPVGRSAVKTSSSSSLNLFGGSKGGGGDAAKKPGMMDQLAMFKKAQEMAGKKKALDEELQKMDFVGTSADGKVVGNFKYVPIANPMDPNPDYEAVSFEFDDEFFESATPEELAESTKSAIQSGIEKTNEAVAEKYATLQEDLMAAFGGMAGGPPPPS